MTRVFVTPETITEESGKIRAGDTLVLQTGKYDRPVFLSGLRGTYLQPIIVEGEEGVMFTSGFPLAGSIDGETEDDYYLRANRIAQQREEAGYYPSVGQTADEAMLVLSDCQFIIIRDISFLNCWPTALYLNDCQNVAMHGLHFEEGTIAIGANGVDTRDLLIEYCSWVQDTTPASDTSGEKGKVSRLWRDIAWSAIHGAKNNQVRGSVDLESDFRGYDGDFFRAWDIAGNVTIRRNTISDAFNAIHFFNRIDRLAPGVDPSELTFNGGKRASANVVIENNSFERIRDNAIEPENFAWNWVVRHNTFANCYRPFSLELDRHSWLYIYGNRGWMLDRPGSARNTERRGGSMFKLGGAQLAEGDVYVFNNSWLFGRSERVWSARSLGGLKHRNNAIGFKRPDEARTFGRAGKVPSSALATFDEEMELEEGRFTRRWSELGIVMDGDIVQDALFPLAYRSVGYPLELQSRGGDPGFASTDGPNPDLTLAPGALATGRSIGWTMKLPGWTEKSADDFEVDMPGMKNVGAYQPPGTYENFEERFKFLPDCPVDPELYGALTTANV